jgi:hypothetical protein
MFKPKASFPEQAIVLMFDLEGFSKFFSQPDVDTYVPKYLNNVLEALDIVINGGEAYYIDSEEDDLKKDNYPPLPKPIHTKFLGDGMLYIWKYHDFEKKEITALLNRLWNLKINFANVNKKTSEDVPVIDIPQRIRFGISAGSVYKLTYNSSKKEEFIGYSINLASRLQSYCRELGFVASARLNAPHKTLSDSKYKRVIATQIKGFPREIVIVDEEEYNSLSYNLRIELFEELP